MAQATALLTILTDEPTATSDLYDRVGYPGLVRIGLVAYPAFRDQLERLAAAGLAVAETAPDGTTRWRRAVPQEP
jgi:hypothetical protein